jgi:hypothetical protein
LQKYKRGEVKYVLVEFYKPFIQYPCRKPSLDDQVAAEEAGYLTPFKTLWMKNTAEGQSELRCSTIVSSFKAKLERGKFKIPLDVSGDRHERDVKAQLETLQTDWVESGFDVDISAA